jgi:hypothetical protein
MIGGIYMVNMHDKSALEAVTTTDQVVVSDGLLNFDTNTVLSGCSITHIAGSNTVRIGKRGLYMVAVNVDLTPTAAGDIAIQLLNNGVAVPGALATVTGAAGDTYSLAFTALVRVLPSCCAIDNTSNLQVQVTAAGTVTNANIVVVKEA